MDPIYRHTQPGTLLFLTAIPGVAALLLGALAVPGPLALPLVASAVVFGGASYAFSSLTVEATPTEVKWFFGPGFWRKTLSRAEIATAAPVENKWWWGWGIHLTPRGWLYNIGGLAAVEIALKDGRTTLRIGSDEAAALARALATGH